MKTYRVIGDILKAFSVDIELEDDNEASLDDEKTLETIAEALGLQRYGRDEGLDVIEIFEIDEHGEEIEVENKEKLSS